MIIPDELFDHFGFNHWPMCSYKYYKVEENDNILASFDGKNWMIYAIKLNGIYNEIQKYYFEKDIHSLLND